MTNHRMFGEYVGTLAQRGALCGGPRPAVWRRSTIDGCLPSRPGRSIPALHSPSRPASAPGGSCVSGPLSHPSIVGRFR